MKLTDRDINTIKSILDVAARKGDFQLAANAADKIKNHLKIQSSMSPFDFLEKVLMDTIIFHEIKRSQLPLTINAVAAIDSIAKTIKTRLIINIPI